VQNASWSNPAVIDLNQDSRVQFEREGYCFVEPEDYREDEPVCNRIVPLKDSWAPK